MVRLQFDSKFDQTPISRARILQELEDVHLASDQWIIVQSPANRS